MAKVQNIFGSYKSFSLFFGIWPKTSCIGGVCYRFIVLWRLGVLVVLQGDEALKVGVVFLSNGLHGDILMREDELLESVGELTLKCPACLSPLFCSRSYAIGQSPQRFIKLWQYSSLDICFQLIGWRG